MTPRADPYRLSLSVTDTNGRVTKWGPDSPAGGDIPQDLEFGTSLPGGYKDLQCSLLRDWRSPNPDNNLLDFLRLYGPGNVSAFEGYFSQFPKRLGSDFAIEPGGVGPSTLLGFFPGFRMVYVDRDASAWGDGGLDARTTQNASFADMSWSNDHGGAICSLPGTLGAQASMAELWYEAPAGITLGKVAFIGQDSNMPGTWEVPKLVIGASVGSRDDTFNVTLDNTLRSQVPTTFRRCAMFRVHNLGLAATPAQPAYRKLTALAAYASHGLTTRAIDAATPDGIYNCDIVADILQRGAPWLKYTTGSGGSIEPNTVIVPHLAFKDLTKPQDAIARASAFGISPLLLPDWGVYDDLLFFWRTPDPDRLCWKTRIADGAKPRFEGTQSDDVFSGVVISFTDPTGVQRVVGPPAQYWPGGVALADTTDSSLVDTSSTNTVNAHGLQPKWMPLQLTETQTTQGAIALGAVALQVAMLPQRRGQIDLTGMVEHPTAGPLPVWMIKAGDYLQITDDGDDKDVKRRIIETRYVHATRTLTATVGSTPFTLDALLEQMQAVMVGALGG